ncbi:molecular chaperone DnaJ [Ruegeria sp. ANG-R]|uniref:J domain-containing protein n=1 Tax=Ruegeria sp. ANG-R TaxID=1577903 RepID=UPI00057E85D7|nr:J domain-containing protein [Ruegeria sp. ANG-R]KIC41557.1 molecular chaperone DnaJ [Ruegeria sp. ANG-R]
MEPVSKIKARAEALQVLGLPPGANANEIREAWRNVAFHDHPDHTDGDYSGFSQAKAAYDFLRREGMTCKGSSDSSVPRRPRLKKRVIELAAEEIKACRDLLSSDRALSDFSEPDGPGATEVKIASSDHIPDAIGCFGRDLTYFIASPVCEGSNRVALPTSVLASCRKAETEILTFQSKSSGSGDIVIPDPIRERKFPGAKSVRIRFEADQQMRDMFELAG